jgi:hypothetical protein
LDDVAFLGRRVNGRGDNATQGSMVGTVRSKIKKIEIAMINTLQLTARKNLIQMSLLIIIDY